MSGHPCDSCQRWSECNGVDAPNCPLVKTWEERMGNRDRLMAALLDDQTESGLLEE